MAQITKRRRKDGESRYDVRTRIDGRVVTRTFQRRRDADAYATTTAADRLRGVVIDPRRSQITVREYSASGWRIGMTGPSEPSSSTAGFSTGTYARP